jgi:ATP-binding cassette subfamily F protein 3
MKGNFLMLDEPTNHLDMQSVEMLIEALNKYEGTLILVSHDRYFISQVANKIWWIEDQKIKEFEGPYDEWQVFMQDRDKRQKQQAATTSAPVPEKKIEKPKQEKPALNVNEQRDLQREYQKQQKAFQKLEEQMNRLKEEKTTLEAQLADPAFYSDKDKFQKVDEAYRQLTTKLDALNKDYDKAFEQIMELEEKLG